MEPIEYDPEQDLREKSLYLAIQHHAFNNQPAHIQPALIEATLHTADTFFSYIKSGRSVKVDPNQAELFVTQ